MLVYVTFVDTFKYLITNRKNLCYIILICVHFIKFRFNKINKYKKNKNKIQPNKSRILHKNKQIIQNVFGCLIKMNIIK